MFRGRLLRCITKWLQRCFPLCNGISGKPGAQIVRQLHAQTTQAPDHDGDLALLQAAPVDQYRFDQLFDQYGDSVLNYCYYRLGTWEEAEDAAQQVFVNALKTGRHMGVGRPIMPPMPWQSYAQMTEEDLKAMFAYLRTVDPKKNQVPEAVVNAPPEAPTAPPSQAR